MMEAANLGKRHDLPAVGRLDEPPVRGVLALWLL